MRSTDVADAIVNCEMMVCIESGPAHDLKWCPLPSHEPVSLRWLVGLLIC